MRHPYGFCSGNKTWAGRRSRPLELDEVESSIQADDAGGIRPHLGMQRVRLVVRAEDLQKALDILRQSN